MKKWKKAVLAAVLSVLGLAILVAGVLGFMFWNFNRWPFDLKRLARLSDQTNLHEARQILGNPNSVFVCTNQNGQACQTWAYSAPGAWPIVYIYFDPDGTYSTNECDF